VEGKKGREKNQINYGLKVGEKWHGKKYKNKGEGIVGKRG